VERDIKRLEEKRRSDITREEKEQVSPCTKERITRRLVSEAETMKEVRAEETECPCCYRRSQCCKNNGFS